MVDEVLTAGVCMVRVHAYIFKKCNRILFLKRKEKKSWIPKDKICILLCSPLLSYILHWILFKIYSALQCMVIWSQQWDAPACPSPPPTWNISHASQVRASQHRKSHDATSNPIIAPSVHASKIRRPYVEERDSRRSWWADCYAYNAAMELKRGYKSCNQFS